MSKTSDSDLADIIANHGELIIKLILIMFGIPVVIAIVIYAADALTAKANTAKQHEEAVVAERFGDDAVGKIEVIIDQTNGVTYVVRLTSDSASMTVLLDADGKPHIDEEWLSQHQND